MTQPNADLTPLSTLRTETHFIPPHPPSNLPNSSASGKPLLIYRQAFTFPNDNNTTTSRDATAEAIERHLRDINAVTPQWRYGMYPTSHFHSTTHEVLCVSSGSARLLFGGEENPGRVVVTVQRGDVIVVPAGVAHRLIQEVEEGFEMVGAYPVGAEQWDMCYAGEAGKEEEWVGRIKRLGWFGRDPVYRETGPVLEV
ncbi:RmlC-like cupin domain-containing protein [Achaetomium macrosporum]|uniref:RmlC-like cupin domain-containing protein n=1 Tax=Achaetomium macrosporum TaxID=79813 RepID=A0AAN7HF39_9PEZI|nr:RmlC-like cupin domain-containing protein [Achaetomium macrosporum]